MRRRKKRDEAVVVVVEKSAVPPPRNTSSHHTALSSSMRSELLPVTLSNPVAFERDETRPPSCRSPPSTSFASVGSPANVELLPGRRSMMMPCYVGRLE